MSEYFIFASANTLFLALTSDSSIDDEKQRKSLSQKPVGGRCMSNSRRQQGELVMLKLKMLDVVIEKNYLIKTLPDLCKICKTAEVGMEEQNMQNHMKRNKIHAHRLGRIRRN